MMLRISVTILLLVLAGITLSACKTESTKCLDMGGIGATIDGRWLCIERGFKVIDIYQ